MGESLQEKKTDVVMYSSTWTLGREDLYQVAFPAIYLFDGQGFIVRKSSNIHSLNDLAGKTVCATANTTSYQNLIDMLESRNIEAKVMSSNGDSFFRGSCDVYTADRMNLAINRANRASNRAANTCQVAAKSNNVPSLSNRIASMLRAIDTPQVQ